MNSMQQFKEEMEDLNLDAAYLAERPEVIHDLDLETERLQQQMDLNSLRLRLFRSKMAVANAIGIGVFGRHFTAANSRIHGSYLKTADGTRTLLRRVK